jgi:hypothetical protein
LGAIAVGIWLHAGSGQGREAFGRSLCLKRINWNVLYLHPRSVYPIFSSPAMLRPTLLSQQPIHETVAPFLPSSAQNTGTRRGWSLTNRSPLPGFVGSDPYLWKFSCVEHLSIHLRMFSVYLKLLFAYLWIICVIDQRLAHPQGSTTSSMCPTACSSSSSSRSEFREHMGEDCRYNDQVMACGPY